MRLVSTSALLASELVPEAAAAGAWLLLPSPPFVSLAAAVVPPLPTSEPDLWEPDEEDGRSGSLSGLGCISVKGSSATSSLNIQGKKQIPE